MDKHHQLNGRFIPSWEAFPSYLNCRCIAVPVIIGNKTGFNKFYQLLLDLKHSPIIL